MFVFADAELAHRHGKRFRTRQHVRQGRGVIGEGFDIEKPRQAGALRDIQRERHDALARRGHARVDNLNFRVVAVLNQPVGGDKI